MSEVSLGRFPRAYEVSPNMATSLTYAKAPEGPKPEDRAPHIENSGDAVQLLIMKDQLLKYKVPNPPKPLEDPNGGGQMAKLNNALDVRV